MRTYRSGQDSISGHWQSLWYHGLANAPSGLHQTVSAVSFGGPPENQARGDYVAIRIILQAMAEDKGIDAGKIVDCFEKAAAFDLLKPRKGTFRAWDHQLLQEMDVVGVKR